MTKNSLNREQKKAVEHDKGPLLIIAGAGTGKTNVITNRIIWLIKNKGVKPEEILALTFTEKAAQEMEERVDKLLPMGYIETWITTFHSFCEKILRQEALELGLSPSFKILTTPEQWLLIRRNLFAFPISYYRPLGNPTKFIHALAKLISRAKDEDVSPTDFLKLAKKKEREVKKSEDAVLKEEAAKIKELAESRQVYEDLMVKEGYMDFGDLIINALKLFREHPDVLAKYQEKFKCILVDEFQDTNFAQNELIKILSAKHKNITVCGDDDQAIYKFRGASVANILDFEKAFKGCTKIVLTKNYRSPQEILDIAYRVIKNNDPYRLEASEGVVKRLSGRKEKLPNIFHWHFYNLQEETSKVSKEISRLVQDKKYHFKDFAILLRANNQAENWELALSALDIPYYVFGSQGLYKQPEIKDLIAYLKVLSEPDDNVSFFRLLNLNCFQFDSYDRLKLLNLSRKKNLSLFELFLSLYEIRFLQKKTYQSAEKLKKIIKRHLEAIKEKTASQILADFINKSGYLKELLRKADENADKILNVNEFFGKIREFEATSEEKDVIAFVDYLDLAISGGESPAQALLPEEMDAVRIMTVHAAKGLEFPIVFLVSLTNDKFPCRDKKDLIELPEELIKEKKPSADFHLQEERRLFYVGMTRAKDLLYLTSADYYTAKQKKKASLFLREAGIKEETVLPASDHQQLQIPALAKKRKFAKREVKLPQFLSYSQMEVFKTCPLQYKFRYIYRLPISPSSALSFGSTMHTVLRDFYRFLQRGKKLTKDQLVKLLHNSWINEGYTSENHEKMRLKQGEEILRRYFEKNKDRLNPPLFIEQDFRLPFGNFTLVGRIDRIDPTKAGKVEVIDYKTGKAWEQKEADRDLQLSIYALAAEEVFKLRPEKLTLEFLEHQKTISTQRGEGEIAKVKKQLQEVAKKIIESDFSPYPSEYHCRQCDFRLICDFSAV